MKLEAFLTSVPTFHQTEKLKQKLQKTYKEGTFYKTAHLELGNVRKN
jgi:hypothetical protein